MSGTGETDEVVRALADPAFHPDRPVEVVHVQTHISHVFVADRFTWKMKKPVRFSFADFSTLAARRDACADELRLNRRLAPELYRDVVAIRGPRRQARCFGEGPVIEWAVRIDRFLTRRRIVHPLFVVAIGSPKPLD